MKNGAYSHENSIFKDAKSKGYAYCRHLLHIPVNSLQFTYSAFVENNGKEIKIVSATNEYLYYDYGYNAINLFTW